MMTRDQPRHLNGGTKPDLATVAWSTSKAFILLGKGNGKLQYSATDARYNLPLQSGTETGFPPGKITIADMDQDGFGDLVVTGNGTVDTIDDGFDTHTSVVVVLINKFELTTGGP